MDTLKNIIYSSQAKACWHYTKIGFKFWWRHFLTIFTVSLFLVAIYCTNAEMILVMSFCTIFGYSLDEARQDPSKIKWGSKSKYTPINKIRSLDLLNTWDISIPGSVAQFNHMNRRL